MKWIVFALGLACILPLAGWLRSHPGHFPKVWILIGALPFLIGAFPKYEIAILGEPLWPGISKGFNVSVVDLLVWAAYLGSPRAGSKSPGRLPLKLSFALYFGAVLLSAFHAPSPTATYFYAWQILRMFVVYAVVARACTEMHLTTSVLKGMALGLCFETAFVFWQRFVLHYLHVGGTFGHQNNTGFALHFIIFPFFALLLSGERSKLVIATPIMGLIIDFITASRAAIGLLGIGTALLFLLSMVRKWTSRKARILVASLFVLVLLSPLAYRQFQLRFGASGESEFTTGGREILVDAAQMILADHPWGVGANNFFVVANTQGYYHRAGVITVSADLIPHNSYWVTAAETGYIGIAAFMVFLIRPLMLALSCGWKNRKDQRGDLLLGLAMSLIVIYIHSFFEWILLFDMIQYLFAISVGMIAGLTLQLSRKSQSDFNKIS